MLRYVLVVGALVVAPVSQSLTSPQAAVMKVDEAYRLAKLANDTNTLARVFTDDFYEMNQNGNGRTKAEAIALWRDFRIASLKTDRADVRISGNTAIVTGEQTEENDTGVDRKLFMRTYVKTGSAWRLLASMQFRNPRGMPIRTQPAP
jgi:ketosteroid isomerase-like protein